ncbi:MAG: GNAT family N-acetyltransferase [Proteobacteria bacterium]|nr:GNAT family N-acetyltransferase [Pseudomonadota bacterium]
MSEILTEAAAWVRDAGEPLWRPEQVVVERVASDCEAGLFFLAWSGATAVGTMRITDADPDFWPEAQPGEAVYLHRLAVRRAAAGGRASTPLLRHASEVASRRGARFLRLDALADRHSLRSVYERFGFAFHSHHTVRGAHVARYELDLHAARESAAAGSSRA